MVCFYPNKSEFKRCFQEDPVIDTDLITTLLGVPSKSRILDLNNGNFHRDPMYLGSCMLFNAKLSLVKLRDISNLHNHC